MTHDSEWDELEALATPESAPSEYFKSGRARARAVKGARLFAQRGNASIRRLLNLPGSRKKPITLPKVSA